MPDSVRRENQNVPVFLSYGCLRGEAVRSGEAKRRRHRIATRREIQNLIAILHWLPLILLFYSNVSVPNLIARLYLNWYKVTGVLVAVYCLFATDPVAAVRKGVLMHHLRM